MIPKTFTDLRKEHGFPEHKFIVTSLGEVIRVDKTVDSDGLSLEPDKYFCGCVNLGRLAKAIGHEPSRAEIDYEFIRELTQFCNLVEYKFVRRVWKLQKHNEGRFRIYGTIGLDDTQFVWLVTEFQALVAEKEFWRELVKIAHSLGGGIRTIHKAPHCDHSMLHYGTPDQIDIYGPNHGKMERQVEMYWNITDWDEKKFLIERYRLAERTQKVWHDRGVGVC